MTRENDEAGGPDAGGERPRRGRALRWVAGLGLGLPASVVGACALLLAALAALPPQASRKPLMILPGLVVPGDPADYRRIVTGDRTPVRHSIMGRTFAIPRAYMPWAQHHRPQDQRKDALLLIEAKLPDLAPYARDPFAGNNGILTPEEHRERIRIKLHNIVFDRPVAVRYEWANPSECRRDAATGFEVCPYLGSTEIWRKKRGKARIGMTCDTGENPPPRPHCEVDVPLIQNISIKVRFLAEHLPRAEAILAKAVDRVCGWYEPDPENRPLTFNYCEERLYAPESPAATQ